MGDEDQRGAKPLLQIADEAEDLRLDGDVERGGGLVGNEDARVACQGQGNHGALAHTARQFVRELFGAARGIGHLHQLQRLEGALHRRAMANFAMLAHGFGDLFANGQHWVECGQRLLEDHRDALAAQILDAMLIHGEQILAVDQDLAFGDAGRFGQQTQQRQRRHGLAAAGFADDAQRLARPHRERHVGDDGVGAAVGADFDGQVVDRDHRQTVAVLLCCHGAAIAPRRRGCRP